MSKTYAIPEIMWARWPNFKPWEFACRCCGVEDMDPVALDAIQEMRSLANAPLHPTSGWRCIRHNKRVGGTDRSQHPKGRAIDGSITGLGVAEMYRIAEEVPAFATGGIGIYPERGFVHVDVRPWECRWGWLRGQGYVDFDVAWRWMERRNMT